MGLLKQGEKFAEFAEAVFEALSNEQLREKIASDATFRDKLATALAAVANIEISAAYGIRAV